MAKKKDTEQQPEAQPTEVDPSVDTGEHDSVEVPTPDELKDQAQQAHPQTGENVNEDTQPA
jgi:hypothetical protein